MRRNLSIQGTMGDDRCYCLEYRRETSAIQPSLRITARLRKNQFAATRKLIHFADSIMFNGLTLSREDKRLVRHWIAVAASFAALCAAGQVWTPNYGKA